jgi:hypothetical protein
MRDKCTARDRRRCKRFHHEVAVRHRIERIRSRAVEAQSLGGHLAVERKRGSRQRRRAEWAFVQTLARIGEAAAIPLRHFDKGEQMMAEGHRLGGL